MDGPDEPMGLLYEDGRFEQTTKAPALRRRGGFVAAGGALAWIESDGSHYARIWTRDRKGRIRMRVDVNPEIRSGIWERRKLSDGGMLPARNCMAYSSGPKRSTRR